MPNYQFGRLWDAFRNDARPYIREFHARHQSVTQGQEEHLMALLASASETAFGRAHGFTTITSYTDYVRRVPIFTWASMRSWVDKVSTSDPTALTSLAPLFLEPTSGSSAQRKLIPYTAQLLAEFQSAIIVWLSSLYDAFPEIAAGRVFWAMSPPVQNADVTGNGTPVSGGDDTVYLRNSIVMPLLECVLSPPDMAGNHVDWRMQSLMALVDADDLTLVSVWSPTFLLSLLQPILVSDTGNQISGSAQRVIDMVAPARKPSVLKAIQEQNFNFLWPNLSVISCWADGPSNRFSRRLGVLFPDTTILPKGLWATEGVISVSYGAFDRCPLALSSHFLEFVADDGSVVLAGQLQSGQCYRPLLTTAGGLYRYDLGDHVELAEPIPSCVDAEALTPDDPALICIRFAGRADSRCDLVGEKLDEALCVQAIGPLVSEGTGIALLPNLEQVIPGYVLLVDGLTATQASELHEVAEAALLQIHHYAMARSQGQLSALVVARVASVSDELQSAWESLGLRAGDFKPAVLVFSLPVAQALVKQIKSLIQEQT